jgi:hypothetical protein
MQRKGTNKKDNTLMIVGVVGLGVIGYFLLKEKDTGTTAPQANRSNVPYPDVVSADPNVEVKIQVERIKAELRALEADFNYHHGMCDLYLAQKKWDKYNYHDGVRRELEREIIMKKGELSSYELLLT